MCDGDWIGKNCDFNAVTTTLFMQPPPSPHEICSANAWRTQASIAFIAEVEQLHGAARCRPATALLHRNLETRQGLGAMMLFAVGAITMSMQRNMAAVCAGQFFYDSWGACKQQPDFEPPLLCLFEPVWGCTSSALIAAANGSSKVATSDPEESVQELTSFDSSAYEVPAVTLPPLLFHFSFVLISRLFSFLFCSHFSVVLISLLFSFLFCSQVIHSHRALGYFWQQALLLSYAPSRSQNRGHHNSFISPTSAISCGRALLCAANSPPSKSPLTFSPVASQCTCAQATLAGWPTC